MTAEAQHAAAPISITVNGIKQDAVVEPRTLLVYFLREHLGLTGTHVGCDTSQCGACTVELNGRAVKSCSVLAVQANGGAKRRPGAGQPHHAQRETEQELCANAFGGYALE